MAKKSYKANTEQLRRMIRFLYENPFSNRLSIREFFTLNGKVVDDGVRFLLDLGIIKEERKNTINRYWVVKDKIPMLDKFEEYIQDVEKGLVK